MCNSSQMASEENQTRDGAAVRFPPPLVPVIAMAVGAALQHFVWPLRLPLEGVARYGAALLLLAAGIGLVAAAIGLFRSTQQNPEPWASTPEIISTGVYRFTRNPMYVSFGLIQAGIGIALANAWFLLLVPVVWGIVYLIAIRHEEAYLEEKFGSVYTDYKATVRRWL
jgi:protein-S-isoprenylcysteine O-methyltransferase Ste14